MKIITVRVCSFAATAREGDCSGKKNCATMALVVTQPKSPAAIVKEKTYELADGNIITVGAKCFRCAKVLLRPNFIGKGSSGIHGMSFQMKCDVDIRKELYANVVLSVARTRSK